MSLYDLPNRLLKATCLRPNYVLRRQILVGFGSIAVIFIPLSVILAILSVINAGDLIQKKTTALIKSQVEQSVREASKYEADIFEEHIANLRSGVSLIVEAVRDRVVGYPNDDWQNDIHVPFLDTETGQNKYPLQNPLLPLEWQVLRTDQTESTSQRQQDIGWKRLYKGHTTISTATPIFTFAGNCDPSVTDPTQPGFYPNCSNANNNYQTGGVIRPNKDTFYIAQKAADLGVAFLKPTWEYHQDVVQISIHFRAGFGTSVHFPAIPHNSTAAYQSIGCSWLQEFINPYTDRPYGTREEINQCHSEGSMVPHLERNPLELPQCKNSATKPGETTTYGPYRHSRLSDIWVVSIGQAIFDRRTNEFIGCVEMEVAADVLAEYLASTVVGVDTNVAIVRRDGIIIASAVWKDSVIQPASQATQTLWEAGFCTSDVAENLLDLWQDEFKAKVWTKEEVTEAYENNIVEADGRILTAVPIPKPPPVYDENYKPQYYVVLSVGGKVFNTVKETEQEIADDVSDVTQIAIWIALGGIAAILLTLWSVSRALTMPLLWMDGISSKIVNHTREEASQHFSVMSKRASYVSSFAKEVNSGMVQEPKYPLQRTCTPKTEVTVLVEEFRRMIQGFSGQGAPSVARPQGHEIQNRLTWRDEFQELYELLTLTPDHDNMTHITDRSNRNKKPQINDDESKSQDHTSQISANVDMSDSQSNGPITKKKRTNSIVNIDLDDITDDSEFDSSYFHLNKYANRTSLQSGAPKLNQGSVLRTLRYETDGTKSLEGSEPIYTFRSSLFWWIVVLIVLPLIFTNIIICAGVARIISSELPEWVGISEQTSLQTELNSLKSAAILRATFSEEVFFQPIRDLNLLTRVAGLLLFGGIHRSNAFPETETKFVDECKTYSNDRSCPFFSDPIRNPCDCAWNDGWGTPCRGYPSDSRYLQHPWMICQARDTDPITGAKSISRSYPEFGTTPESTLWWTNASDMPGAHKGVNASGYETTYDRFRVISALAATAMPIYNYINTASNLKDRTTLTTYFTFDLDGLFWGYSGCYDGLAGFAHFESTDGNGAHLVNPNICPKGKFGYDSRCRGWYVGVRDALLKRNEKIFVTPPYKFATEPTAIGTSAGSAVVDPKTGEYVGQTLVFLAPGAIIKTLVNETSSDLSFLITPSADFDTVVGPNHSVGDAQASITDLVLPFDEVGSKNRIRFEMIRSKMKTGETGQEGFTRTASDGTEETIRLAFAPIRARTLAPIDASDIANGVIGDETLLYSVAVARLEDNLKRPFEEIENDVNESLDKLKAAYISLNVILSILCFLSTAWVAYAVTRPVLVLLRIVENVNKGRIEERMPPLDGGSGEVHHVYNSFAKLNRLVRVSTRTFYSGNFVSTHDVVSDALRLFGKVSDKKAIAIACNNLGNALFALARITRRGDICIEFNGICAVRSALVHYSDAILMGTYSFDEAVSIEEKEDHAQVLADRHFNRAMLLIDSLNDPCCPKQARDEAYSDLKRVQELDRFVNDSWLERRALFLKCHLCFERLIRRIHGLTAMIQKDENVHTIWDPSDLIEHADQILTVAWDKSTAPIFNEMDKVGRLQQLEGAAMAFEIVRGKETMAARIGIRMLAEDEYMLDTSFVTVAEALFRSMNNESHAPEDIKSRNEILSMLASCKVVKTQMGKSVVFCIEVGVEFVDDHYFRKQLNQYCLALYTDHCDDNDIVGIIANTEQGNVYARMDKKSPLNRQSIDSATKFAGVEGDCEQLLPMAYHEALTFSNATTRSSMLGERGDCLAPTYILYVTDGSSVRTEEAFQALQNRIKEIQQTQKNPIHLLAIGISTEETNNDNTTSSTSSETPLTPTMSRLQQFCNSVSDQSLFIPATRKTLDGAFVLVMSLITSNRKFLSLGFQLGVTMEQF